MALNTEVHNYVWNNLRTPKKAYDLRDYQPMRIETLSLLATATYGSVDSITISDHQRGPLKTISRDNFTEFWQMTVDISPARTQYRQIKADQNWQMIHRLSRRPISYLINDALVSQLVNDSIPCCSCGVIMTLDATTIDHRHPQAGGQQYAARKVLRAMGLTQAAARSDAGQVISEFSRFAQDRMGQPGCTLTYIGMIFFTCLYLSGKYQEFSLTCLNHPVNLQPMCFRCNSQKGAWGY